MKLVPVALVVFYEMQEESLKVWVQTRIDDGPFHGLLEFPGGGIESGETPLEAAVREVEEEVGIVIQPIDGKFMGTYQNEHATKSILLYVFLFPRTQALNDKGQWLTITQPELSSSFKGLIPPPNHKIIDDLFLALLS
jgi:8-oxo-dGTP diphosphatase